MFNKKRIVGVLTSAVLLAAMIGAPAHAAINLDITPGTLNFDGGAPAIGNFSGVTLNGTPQLTSLTVDPFTVVDATGSGAGWNVLLTVPDLSDGLGDTILASNISMTAPVVTAAATSDITGVVGQASSGGFNAGEKIVDASLGDGEGTYLVAPRILKLTIPVTTIAGTYTSAATIATVSGP
ncbi:MAG: hypothetical protein ACLPVY_00700 [Acidimicrobiia bacterium]